MNRLSLVPTIKGTLCIEGKVLTNKVYRYSLKNEKNKYFGSLCLHNGTWKFNPPVSGLLTSDSLIDIALFLGRMNEHLKIKLKEMSNED